MSDEIFDAVMAELKRATKLEVGTILLAMRKVATSSGMKAKIEDDSLVVSQPEGRGLSSHTTIGYYDLKPAFQNSSSARMSKKGTWYVIVPIRRKTKSMSNNLYKQARNITIGTTQRLENLLEERPEEMSPFGQLPSNLNAYGQQDLSGNITRYSNGKGKGSRYIAFRTVNANSPANSWIIKYNMNTDELEKSQAAFDDIVNGVIK